MVVIVGVGKEQIVFCKDETTAQVNIGQMDFLRILCGQYILFFIGKASAGLVSEIKTGFPVPDNLGGLFYINGTVVGGQ
jgi:hypothetical protein